MTPFRGALKGTELRRQREPKTQIFAENHRFSQIHPFSWKFQHLEGAGNRRKPQIFAGFPKIFAENCRKPQIGLRHLRCVTFSSALPLVCTLLKKKKPSKSLMASGTPKASASCVTMRPTWSWLCKPRSEHLWQWWFSARSAWETTNTKQSWAECSKMVRFLVALDVRAGFRQNGFFADFYFWAAGFFRGFSRRIFLLIFVGKSAQKILQENPRENPPKSIQQKSSNTFLQIAQGNRWPDSRESIRRFARISGVARVRLADLNGPK